MSQSGLRALALRAHTSPALERAPALHRMRHATCTVSSAQLLRSVVCSFPTTPCLLAPPPPLPHATLPLHAAAPRFPAVRTVCITYLACVVLALPLARPVRVPPGVLHAPPAIPAPRFPPTRVSAPPATRHPAPTCGVYTVHSR
eukprot:2408801-Prymnesium_polylepis.2